MLWNGRVKYFCSRILCHLLNSLVLLAAACFALLPTDPFKPSRQTEHALICSSTLTRLSVGSVYPLQASTSLTHLIVLVVRSREKYSANPGHHAVIAASYKDRKIHASTWCKYSFDTKTHLGDFQVDYQLTFLDSILKPIQPGVQLHQDSARHT